MKTEQLIKNFREIFQGLDRAYGFYNVTKNEGLKRVGPRKTVQQPVTAKLWEDHLKGINGLGIVPINDNNECFFGAIDIDKYVGLNYSAIVKKIEESGLPLICFRSKSGGLHAFTFTAEPVPASLMREKLTQWAAVLEHAESEIFPKQDKILIERGDLGSWINIPYFNARDTDRYAFDSEGRPLKVDDFLSLVQSCRLTKKEFIDISVKMKGDIGDGPPCLECMLTYGVKAGTRNDALFNLGVYLRRARPETWGADLYDMNYHYFDPPLDGPEVDHVVKSLEGKEYFYACNREPLKSYCNKTECKTREHGITGGTTVKLKDLTKYDTRPPLWFVSVEDSGRLELTTEDLQNQQRFQKCCMDQLNIITPTVKRPIWVSLVQELFQNLTLIEAPVDASPVGQLLEHVEHFCCGRSQAKDRAEILLGKPWKETGRHYFRSSALMTYLDKQGIREFKINRITSILKQNGGKHEFFNIKGKGLNVWSMPEYEEQKEKFDTPEMGEGEAF